MNKRRYGWPRTIVYLLAIWMMWACVAPVTTLTILRSKTVLFLFLLVMMALFYFRAPSWLVMLAGLSLIGWVTHYFFFADRPFFSLEWPLRLIRTIVVDSGRVWHGDLIELSDLYCAFLFFVLLWLIGLAVRHWIERKTGYLMLFLAIVVLAAMDSLTYVNTSRTIVLTAGLGLALIGIQNYRRMHARAGLVTRDMLHWLAAAGIIATVMLAAGLIGPKGGPYFESPITYLQQAGLIGGNSVGSLFSGQRIGYDEDDTSLGGSLVMDSTLLFTAHVGGGDGYWRVAEKSVYTGKGWADSHRVFVPLNRLRSDRLRLFESRTKSIERSTSISFSQASPAVLPYLGQLKTMRVPGKRLKIDLSSGQVKTFDERTAHSSSFTYLEPIYQVSELRKIHGNDADPTDIRSEYLQLPDQLPQRVRKLGKRLTAKGKNRYDQVRAIVNYLRSPHFTYSTDGVVRPGKKQDYVDQFLFETRIGYCDNFSTSMVVLLRTAGIPARWVKGFSAGEYGGQAVERVNGKKVVRSIYRVTNEDAHSWVEVYFPGSGWVTFEPTPSFTDPSRFAAARAAESTGSGDASGQRDRSSASASTSSAGDQSQRQNRNRQNGTAESKTMQAGQQQKKQQKQAVPRDGVSIDRAFVGEIAAAVLIILAAVLWLTRKRWLSAYYRWRLVRPLTDQSSLKRAYRDLNRLLRLHGLRRRDAQTLREFASVVDARCGGNAMLQLTACYEQTIYTSAARFSRKNRERAAARLRELAGKLQNGALDK